MASKLTRRQKLYGDEFPEKPLSRDPKTSGEAWERWIDARITEQEPVMRQKRLHWARHRHFRAGRQWISTRDGRTWREVNADKNQVRAVMNLIGPALDFRLTLLSEQRPGFKVHPLGTGIEGRETAEAQQNVAEYYYNRLKGEKLLVDAFANAQTDGVGFLHVFVDREAGPLIRNVALIERGDEQYEELLERGYAVNDQGQVVVPLSEEGTPLPPGSEVEEFRAGDIGTRVVLAHEVFVDPEAKTMNGPYDRARWAIIRRVRDLRSARLETGDDQLEAENAANLGDPVLDTIEQPKRFQRGLPTYPSTRRRFENETVYDYLVYIAPDEDSGFERGLWRRVIGNRLVEGGDVLPGGKIPLALLTDGSSDNELFPRPVMSDWIGDQLAINALVSKLIEHVRVYGTGRVIAQKGTLLQETYSDITGSVINWTGSKPDFHSGIRVSSDAWNLLSFLVKKLEDKTGWTELARGAVTGNQGGGMQDVAGRGVLAARELFERQFGPMIRAASRGMTQWAQLVVDYARFLFEDEPRLIPRAGRPDLAQRIAAKDLGDESLVYVDPETLSPLPRALRHQMLWDMLSNGLIDAEEFRRRAPFSEVRNLEMGDTAHWERAQLVNMQIEERAEELAQLEFEQRFLPEEDGIAIYWQDDPEVHMRALNELILDDGQPLIVRDVASERWSAYLMLGQAHQGAVPAPPFVRGAPATAQGGQGQGAQQQGANGAPQQEPPAAGAQPQVSPAPESAPLGVPQGAGITEQLGAMNPEVEVQE